MTRSGGTAPRTAAVVIQKVVSHSSSVPSPITGTPVPTAACSVSRRAGMGIP